MTATSVDFQLGGLYDKQRAAVWDPARIVLIEAGTKTGKTEACTLWLAEQALTRGSRGRIFWWIAPSYRQAQIAHERMQQRLPRSLFVPNFSDLSLRLINGALIEFRTGEKPDALYGFEVDAVVLDEASRMRVEAWHAVRSTLTVTRGPVRMIGNVRGRRNWFYEMSRRAESGEEDGLAYHRLTWRDAVAAGVIEEGEIKDARRDLPEQVFQELYEAEATEDGSNPFGQEAIEKCIVPLGKGPAIRCGVDLARARDYTVVIGLNSDVHVSTFDRWQHLPWTESLARIDQNVSGVKTLVDSTGIGDALLEALQRPIYKGEVHPQSLNQGLAVRTAVGNYEGYHFSSPSKQALMERLALAIQRQEIGFPEGPIVSELQMFEYEYSRNGVKYSAPSGFHDDCVCSLALAVWHMPTRTTTSGRIPGGPVSPGGSKWSGMGGSTFGGYGSKWR